MGKVNKSLKAWVTFVKSVQKKYKLSYRDAIHKAKELKDKGADWMNKGLKSLKGGDGDMEGDMEGEVEGDMEEGEGEALTEGPEMGGRRRRTRKNRGSKQRRSRSR